MKKTKRLILIVTTIILLISALVLPFSKGVYAADKGSNDENYEHVYARARSAYEFNAAELLTLYSELSTGQTEARLKYRLNIPTVGIEAIPVYAYDLIEKEVYNGSWNDGTIDATDASSILALSRGYITDTLGEGITAVDLSNAWSETADDITYSLASALQVDMSDIELTIKVTTPVIEGYTTKEESYFINNKSEITPEIFEVIKEFENLNAQIAEDNNFRDVIPQQVMSLDAKVKGDSNKAYHLAVGTEDETHTKFYLVTIADTTITRNEKFETTMEYKSTSGSNEVTGKYAEDGKTYLPPYYDDNNNKADADVTVTIKSKATEEIVSTNGIALTTDGKPNSEGWFYPNTSEKTVIAKVYPFATYDNTKYNGSITETVKLVGANDGVDAQIPSIKWTFRIKDEAKKENSDGSITYIITYNLPVDPTSIPEGWEPIYDEDGQTIHKITRTFKKGEEYDKDVTVRQNGTGTPKTTHVTVTWPKEDGKEASNLGPQAGAFTAIFAVIIAGIVAFSITRYRKINE